MNGKQKKMLARILLASAMLALLNVVPTRGLVRLGLFLLCYGLIG